MKAPLFVIALLSMGKSVAAQTQPTVTVLNGTLRGTRCSSSDVNSFLSIPYANPPVGNLRFAPPQLFNQKFNGTRDAGTAAPACPQFNVAFNESTPESEDCLFIDVWAPSNATTSSKLPVRVWLFGGSNEAGGISDPLYDGCFASTDTIQVSINYRVGPLGFLVSQSQGLTGNYGTQDQILGLQWVRDNIAAFGGDPTRVMLFGQSAGATDTFVLSSQTETSSLMHAIILESGTYAPLLNVSGADQLNRAYIAALNCSTSNTLTCLRSASLEALETTFIKENYQNYGPVVDGATIASQPLTPLVPAVIGSATNEASLFLLGDYQANAFSLNQSDYYAYLVRKFGTATANIINETYPVSAYASAINPAFEAMAAVVTNTEYRCPAHQLLNATAVAGVPVWTYSFNHTLSCAWYSTLPQLQPVLELLGAAHTAELPFVFGQMTDMPRPNGTCNMTAAEAALSETFRAAWDHVAADAAPGSAWPAYTAAGAQGVNILSDASWEVGTVDYSMCAFWDQFGDRIAALGGSAGLNGTVGGNGNGNGNGSATSSSNPVGPSATTPPASGAAGVMTSSWTGIVAALLYVLVVYFGI